MEDELLKLNGDKKMPLRVIFKRLWKYMRPEMLKFTIALLLLLINVALDITLPLIVSAITNNITSADISLSFIIWMAALYFGIGLINQIFLYIEAMILQKMGQKIVYEIRVEVYEHIINMSQNQFDEMPVGSLVTRVTSYTQSVSDLFTDVILKLIKNVLTIVGVYSIMIYISPMLALVLLGFIIVIAISSFVFSKLSAKVFRTERKCSSDLNAFLSENLSGMRITQAFNQEEKKKKEFDLKNKRLRNAIYRVILSFAFYRPFMTLLYVSAIAVTFILGIQFGLNPGEIVAFYLYLSKFFNPIQEIADQFNKMHKATTALERLFNLLDVAPDVIDKLDAKDIESFKGKIEFKNVWFAYKPGEWILKDVSFVIEPGQTAAFVGATGAGKTTILGLIVRNYEVQKGEILIDGINVNDIKKKSLRNQIGQMMQDVFLFSGSVKSNITLNDDSYTDEEVIEACRYVNAYSFIEKLPHGLNEEVIERGENFSHGQRQLLSFARTVLHKPEILILDEATANIDTETEVVIQESLNKMKSIGTMLVVAHRLSTIQHSDIIIVLSHGKVIEKGNHQELLKNKGHYYKLYELQFKNKEFAVNGD